MAPRLRPEVIVPLRTSASWARTMLVACCAFIMLVTTLDALRYAAQRNTRAREAAAQRARAPGPGDILRRFGKTVPELETLTRGPRAGRPVATSPASPAPAPEPR